MRISGFQKVTLLDYPEHIACTIFLGNCNLRCPFCHNMQLVLHPENYPEFSMDEILSFLKDRKGKLNGVAITGGEPLLNDDIETLLYSIKELEYPIKLDTNGFFPERIERLINEKLVDRFAMDIKSGFTNYLKVSGVKDDIFPDYKDRISKSIWLLINKSNDYEFRTTCVKGLHTESDFYEIKEMIRGAKNYFLQDYKEGPDMQGLPFKSFTKEELESFRDIVKDNVKNVEIRGL